MKTQKSTPTKVFNNLNIKEKVWKKQTFEKDSSLTQPDRSLSLKELLNRHHQGLDLTGGKEPMFDDEGTSKGININTLDLVELQQMREHVQRKIYNLEASRKTEVKIAKEQKTKKEREQAILDAAKLVKEQSEKH